MCREQIELAGLGDTSCGRSFTFCPPEERCLRPAFPGGTVSTISRSLPAARARDGAEGLSGMASPKARSPRRGAKRP